MIDSPRNPRVQRFRSLRERKFRQRERAFVLEGPHLLQEALDTGWPLLEVLFCRELLSPEAEALLERLLDSSVPALEASTRVFRSLSDTETPQGLAAVARLPEQGLESLRLGEHALLLVACEIQDPGNLGTLLRTAAAAGAEAVLATRGTVDAFNPKVVRGSAGAVLRVPVVEDLPLPALVDWADRQDIPLVVATTRAPLAHYEAVYPPRVALVVGNEARGVPEELLNAAHLQVRIPMPGRVESLNAAVAGAILLYEVLRQRSRP